MKNTKIKKSGIIIASQSCRDLPSHFVTSLVANEKGAKELCDLAQGSKLIDVLKQYIMKGIIPVELPSGRAILFGRSSGISYKRCFHYREYASDKSANKEMVCFVLGVPLTDEHSGYLEDSKEVWVYVPVKLVTKKPGNDLFVYFMDRRREWVTKQKENLEKEIVALNEKMKNLYTITDLPTIYPG